MPSEDTIDDWDDLWSACSEAEPDARLQLARDFAADLDDLEHRELVELVNRLYATLADTPAVVEVVGFIDELRNLHTETTQKADPWLRARQVDATIQADTSPPDGAVTDVVSSMEDGPDAVSSAITRMLYHGLGASMLDPLIEAWPELQSSDRIMPWGLRRFAWRTMTLLLVTEIDRRPDLEPDDEQLWNRLSALTVPEQRATNELLVDHFTGTPEHRIDPDDLTDLSLEKLRDSTMMLLAEFTRHLCDRRGWSRGRTALGFTVLDEYFRRVLTDRDHGTGHYTGESDRLDVDWDDASPALLRPGEFGAYLDDQYNDLLTSPYQGVTLIELVDPWMEFLADRGFVDSERAADIRAAIGAEAVDADLVERLEQSTADSILFDDLRQAVEQLRG